MKNSKIHYEEILNETADSVESISSSLFTCGTYQLIPNQDREKSSKNRVGTVRLYEFDNETNVRLLQIISMKAVLDMKWHTDSEKKILNVADSCGTTSFYSLTDKQLFFENSIKIGDKETLCLSTDWFKTSMPSQAAYSLSNGEIVVVRFNNQPVELHRWKAHTLEAWIVATDHHNENIIYSGSDDALLKLWDLRSGFHKPSFLSKHFSVGVCSIQSHQYKENYFAVGSYDESCVIFDNRFMRSPICEANLGGGVWRLKWHPYFESLLLTACMHDGFKIIKCNNSFTSLDIMYHYKNHNSLAYGVDWLCDKNAEKKRVLMDSSSANIASCSFYDKLLTVWGINF